MLQLGGVLSKRSEYYCGIVVTPTNSPRFSPKAKKVEKNCQSPMKLSCEGTIVEDIKKLVESTLYLAALGEKKTTRSVVLRDNAERDSDHGRGDLDQLDLVRTFVKEELKEHRLEIQQLRVEVAELRDLLISLSKNNK